MEASVFCDLKVAEVLSFPKHNRVSRPVGRLFNDPTACVG